MLQVCLLINNLSTHITHMMFMKILIQTRERICIPRLKLPQISVYMSESNFCSSAKITDYTAQTPWVYVMYT